MTGWLSVVYGLIVIFMGPPSQWYHASMKDWGGWFDTMSVVIWLMFNAVYVTYAVTRTMWDKGRQTERTILVLSIWFLLVIICGLIAIKPGARTPLYFVARGTLGARRSGLPNLRICLQRSQISSVLAAVRAQLRAARWDHVPLGLVQRQPRRNRLQRSRMVPRACCLSYPRIVLDCLDVFLIREGCDGLSASFSLRTF